MEKQKEVKIKVTELEYKVLMDTLLKLQTEVSKGFILGGFLQKLVNAFEKEVEKNGKD